MTTLRPTLGAVILLLWLGLTASFTSLVIPAMAYQSTDLVERRYGWPLWFVSQDQSRVAFGTEVSLLGLLAAIGGYVQWRLRLHVVGDADQVFATHTGFIRFTLWWLPLLVAAVSAFAFAFYLHKTYGQP
ncbi:MAG: hypothetical protein DYG89_23815 [Caldilinea sp. CFX5]|nr:hypothetical protein [Caldilinea sp. CFX5]